MERFKQWFGNFPVLSLILMKLCWVNPNSSVVRAEWRWKICGEGCELMRRRYP
jgi:hypothetical protein